MIVTFQHQGKYASVQAPLGSAAFAVFVDAKAPGELHLVFAMMRETDANALVTLNRCRSRPTTLDWHPTVARPELYKAPYFDANAFVEYVFVEENDVWLPKNQVLTNYLTAMQLAQNMPAKPPPELAVDLAASGLLKAT